MSVDLKKGQRIDLTKGNAGLRGVMVGLGWDEAERGGGLFSLIGARRQEIDCDASAILCDEEGNVSEIVYYGSLRDKSDSVIHQGDNLTGAGEGDDEQIFVDLRKIPPAVGKIVFTVNIYDGTQRRQHFGMIRNAFIRLVDISGGGEICRYNLSENYDGMTGLIVGEIYRRGGEWKFSAIGRPVKEASRLDKLLAEM
ncbi:MAG: TerD family protein [Synergistaceae bacterium]|nr:TerD family protein [Synergistaceae bacterium]